MVLEKELITYTPINVLVCFFMRYCMIGRMSERMNYPGNYFCRRFLNEEETAQHFSCDFHALQGRRNS